MADLPATVDFDLRRAAAMLTTVAVALLLLAVALLGKPPQLGVLAVPAEGDPQLLVSVRAGSPSWNAGLRPGDLVHSISLPENLPVWAAFEIAEGQRQGQVISVVQPRSPAVEAVLLGLGLEFLVIALIVCLLASGSVAASYFLLLSWLASLTAISTPIADLGQPWAIYLQWVAGKATVAVFAIFFMTVPVRRWRPLRRLIAWELPPIVVFYTYATLSNADLYEIVQAVGTFYMLIGLGCGFIAMLWPLVTNSPKLEREMWPAAASTVFVVGISLLSRFPLILPNQGSPSAEIVVLVWGLLPLGFAFPILRHRLTGVTLRKWPLFHTVSNSINDAVFVVRNDGQLIYANSAGQALLAASHGSNGTNKFEAMIKDWEVLMDGGVEPASQLLRRVMAGEVVHGEEQRLRVADGRIYSVSATGTPMSNPKGQVHMAVLTYRDITDRKQAEEALQEARTGLECQLEQRTATLSEANDDLQRMLEATIQALALTVEMRDPYTAGHQRRVARLACAMAKEMGLSDQRVNAVNTAATIHDIGKISVLADIFSKPGKLSAAEFSMVKAHATVGGDLLKTVKFPLPVAQMVLQHHERVNGSGYPFGLRGDDILTEAKIVAVADVVEAMAFDRPYRPALGIDEALKEIERNKGVLYDTKVVDTCLRLFEDEGFSFE